MKYLIIALYIGFVILTGYTFYMAGDSFDGLVEPHYYEKSKNYFSTREHEEAMGLKLSFAQDMQRGLNHFSVGMSNASGPMRGAEAALYISKLEDPAQPLVYPLIENAPGSYVVNAVIADRGTWSLRLELQHEGFTTDRRWFATVQ